MVVFALLIFLLVVGRIVFPVDCAFSYTTHFDTGLEGWHVWGTNYAVSDSIVTLYPIGSAEFYIYDYAGVPWVNVDFHVGIKSVGGSINVQLVIWAYNGTNWGVAYGDIYLLTEANGWTDLMWDEDDFEDALCTYFDTPITNFNLTDVVFYIWNPSGSPPDMPNSRSVDDTIYAKIDYVSTMANQWDEDVEDEISSSEQQAQQSTTTTTMSTSTSTSNGGNGGSPLLQDGSLSGLVEGLKQGDLLSWGLTLSLLTVILSVLISVRKLTKKE